VPDVNSAAMGFVAHGSSWAWPLVFIAGVVSSLGPCTSPRIVALSSLVLRSRNPVLVGSAFIGSTIATYAFFGVVGSLVRDLVGYASWIYAGVAVAALAGGIVTLVGANVHRHEERVRERPGREQHLLARGDREAGGAPWPEARAGVCGGTSAGRPHLLHQQPRPPTLGLPRVGADDLA